MHIVSLLGLLLLSGIKLGTEPIWESDDSDYSTGGVLADVDKDSDLDLVTGNGNDMARNHNKVYYNIGDSLEHTASWVSDDAACNGHISLGDIDSDGFLDLAVSGFAYSLDWTPNPSRVYKNVKGQFSTLPVWMGGDSLFSFSCDWGDADGDSDLDLASACGNDYNSARRQIVIFENQNGVLSASPVWQSKDADFNMDVCWVDIDRDGDLDLAAGGYGHNRIYFMEQRKLNPEAGWVSADSHNTVQIAFGDFNSDGYLDMATADNNQNATNESRIRIYKNNAGTLDTLPCWESKLWTYQSCVAWADADGDGDLDLAAGGWWEPLCVYENKSGAFDTIPEWSWSPWDPYSLVCEQVVWGEVNNDNWKEETENLGNLSSGSVVYSKHFPILDLKGVNINGVASPPSDYKWNPADGWIQINKSGNVQLTYRYTSFPDLLVTNWVSTRGNFLFPNLYNDSTTGISGSHNDSSLLKGMTLAKNIITRGEPVSLFSPISQKISQLSVYDITGRRIASLLIDKDVEGSLDIPFNTRNLPRGIYLIEIAAGGGKSILRFQVF
jgi:hypothetical protein